MNRCDETNINNQKELSNERNVKALGLPAKMQKRNSKSLRPYALKDKTLNEREQLSLTALSHWRKERFCNGQEQKR